MLVLCIAMREERRCGVTAQLARHVPDLAAAGEHETSMSYDSLGNQERCFMATTLTLHNASRRDGSLHPLRMIVRTICIRQQIMQGTPCVIAVVYCVCSTCIPVIWYAVVLCCRL